MFANKKNRHVAVDTRSFRYLHCERVREREREKEEEEGTSEKDKIHYAHILFLSSIEGKISSREICLNGNFCCFAASLRLIEGKRKATRNVKYELEIGMFKFGLLIGFF